MSDVGSSEGRAGDERSTLRSEGLDWVDVEGEIVVLDTERSVYLAPNASGALLWRMLVSGATHSDLVTALIEAFEITSERAAQDVKAFLDQLESLGVLARRDG